MTFSQEVITIGMCVLATLITRFLPFIVFSGKKETPQFIQYLGKALPAAIFALLVVYCLKDVSLFGKEKSFFPLPAEPYAICCLFSLYFNCKTKSRPAQKQGGFAVFIAKISVILQIPQALRRALHKSCKARRLCRWSDCFLEIRKVFFL